MTDFSLFTNTAEPCHLPPWVANTHILSTRPLPGRRAPAPCLSSQPGLSAACSRVSRFCGPLQGSCPPSVGLSRELQALCPADEKSRLSALPDGRRGPSGPSLVPPDSVPTLPAPRASAFFPGFLTLAALCRASNLWTTGGPCSRPRHGAELHELSSERRRGGQERHTTSRARRATPHRTPFLPADGYRLAFLPAAAVGRRVLRPPQENDDINHA